jgi:hypothetical protein
MNSATSTESQALQPWQFFTLAGLVGATVVVFLSEGQTAPAIVLLSLVVFGAAAVGATAWRTFSPFTGRDEPAGPQVFGGRTRAALEREKSLVLRSIKDLEFDRAMGKISEKDFAEMSTRLRARAAGLIRQLDAGATYRQAIDAEIDKRLGTKARRSEKKEPAPAPAAAAVAEVPKTTTKLCLSCCTPNDPDARFCKGCGYQLGDW